jgi:hypothetical protein
MFVITVPASSLHKLVKVSYLRKIRSYGGLDNELGATLFYTVVMGMRLTSVISSRVFVPTPVPSDLVLRSKLIAFTFGSFLPTLGIN